MKIDVIRQRGMPILGSRLIRIGERLRSHTQDLMEAHGVPIPVHHYPLLTVLRENGALPISELAGSLSVSQPGVTRSVNQLSKQGFVRIEHGSKDKRIRLISITDSGTDLLDYAEEHFWPLIERRLVTLLGDQSEHFLSLLDRLEDQISDRQLFIEPEENQIE